MDTGRPISYMALQVGTPVVSSSGTQFGTVEQVRQIPPAAAVTCTVSDEEVDALPEPRGTLGLHPDIARDEGPSLTARWGRLFGRTHWKELEE